MRDKIEIKKWMLDNRLTVTEIGKNVGKNQTVVSNTLAGRRNDRKVLQFFLDKGCPGKYLDLPRDMKEAA